MYECFLSQLLVVFLLFISCIRIFFTKTSKIDSGAILPPAAFLTCLLNIFIWNASFMNILLLLLSFIIMATNLRAILRLSAHLLVDRYSFLFIVSTFLEAAAVIFAFILIAADRPVKIDVKKFNVEKTVQRLRGNMSRGFEVPGDDEFFYKSTGTLYTYKNNEFKVSPSVILFAGSDRAEISDYEPYFLFLAQKGWTVLAADFYSNDGQYLEGWKNTRFARKFLSLNRLEEEKTDAQKEAFKLCQVNSYSALTDLALEQFEEKGLYYIFDSLDFDSISKISENAEKNFTGFFALNKLGEYKTPGLGFIEQTDVRLAKKKGLSRDKTLFIPRYAASKTLQELKVLAGEPEKAADTTESENIEEGSNDSELDESAAEPENSAN